jgi:hypothetical protein
MMKKSIWKSFEVKELVNQNLQLIEGKRMNQQTTILVQQQQRCKAFGQLQIKVWNPGKLHQPMKAHDQEVMNVFNLRSLMQEHSGFQNQDLWSRPRGSLKVY